MCNVKNLKNPLKTDLDIVPNRKFGDKGKHGNLGKDIAKEMGMKDIKNPLK